jgi:hypothetical protein
VKRTQESFALVLVSPPSIGFRLADAVLLFIALRGLVILDVSWELRITDWLGL